ncbi:MAG: hypothetical protein WCF93_01225 [Candidatus Moraniibacteriota bacterium]
MNPKKNNQIIIYNTEDGKTKIEVTTSDETVWLSQKQMAELFDKDVNTVGEHVQNVFDEGELVKNPTTRKFRIVQKELRLIQRKNPAVKPNPETQELA